MCFIGFLDLKNIGIDIKIMVIGALRAIFCGGHFEFLYFGREPLE